jgi:hypothetical protein
MADVKCAGCGHWWMSHDGVRKGGCRACECRRFQRPLENAPVMTTRTFRERLTTVTGQPMCWEAALTAFGVTVAPATGGRSILWIREQLEAHGWRTELTEVSKLVPGASWQRITLAYILPHVMAGNWLVFTHHHVITVRDGVIIDTVGKTRTVSRGVNFLLRVKPAETALPVPVNCGCLEPLVFGHAPNHKWRKGMQL